MGVVGSPIKGRFQPGQSGNLNGRPVGSRNKFSETFMRDLATKWQECGGDILNRVAADEPAKFFAVAASLIPKDVSVTLSGRLPGGLEPEDWHLAMACFGAIREALPNADKRPPDEVLNFVLEAIRSHGAKPVETCSDFAKALPSNHNEAELVSHNDVKTVS